jgi:hypothetical protein
MPTVIFAATQEMTPEQYRQIIVASLVVIGLIIVAFVVVAQVRRRLRADDDSSGSGGLGFTLSDLRQLHKSGKMSSEEFERAKAKILEATRRAGERDAASAATSIRDQRQARTGSGVEIKPLPPGGEDDVVPPA